jgi:hypothetical protein
MSKYSIDRIHTPKFFHERRSGKTVDAIVDIIGKVMVTENARIFLVVSFIDRISYVRKMFNDICIEHFEEEPEFISQNEWGIKNYNSRIMVVSFFQWEKNHRDGMNLQPTFDLD